MQHVILESSLTHIHLNIFRLCQHQPLNRSTKDRPFIQRQAQIHVTHGWLMSTSSLKSFHRFMWVKSKFDSKSKWMGLPISQKQSYENNETSTQKSGRSYSPDEQTWIAFQANRNISGNEFAGGYTRTPTFNKKLETTDWWCCKMVSNQYKMDERSQLQSQVHI